MAKTLKQLRESKDDEDHYTVHRGVSVHNRKTTGPHGGQFHSLDREFARQFTQSGQDKEILTHRIKKSHVYHKPEIYAGSEDEFEHHVGEAKKQGYKAIRVNEGHGQPHSIYVFDRSALKR